MHSEISLRPWCRGLPPLNSETYSGLRKYILAVSLPAFAVLFLSMWIERLEQFFSDFEQLRLALVLIATLPGWLGLSLFGLAFVIETEMAKKWTVPKNHARIVLFGWPSQLEKIQTEIDKKFQEKRYLSRTGPEPIRVACVFVLIIFGTWAFFLSDNENNSASIMLAVIGLLVLLFLLMWTKHKTIEYLIAPGKIELVHIGKGSSKPEIFELKDATIKAYLSGMNPRLILNFPNREAEITIAYLKQPFDFVMDVLRSAVHTTR